VTRKTNLLKKTAKWIQYLRNHSATFEHYQEIRKKDEFLDENTKRPVRLMNTFAETRFHHAALMGKLLVENMKILEEFCSMKLWGNKEIPFSLDDIAVAGDIWKDVCLASETLIEACDVLSKSAYHISSQIIHAALLCGKSLQDKLRDHDDENKPDVFERGRGSLCKGT
jgi:hypothetical protein